MRSPGRRRAASRPHWAAAAARLACALATATISPAAARAQTPPAAPLPVPECAASPSSWACVDALEAILETTEETLRTRHEQLRTVGLAAPSTFYELGALREQRSALRFAHRDARNAARAADRAAHRVRIGVGWEGAYHSFGVDEGDSDLYPTLVIQSTAIRVAFVHPFGQRAALHVGADAAGGVARVTYSTGSDDFCVAFCGNRERRGSDTAKAGAFGAHLGLQWALGNTVSFGPSLRVRRVLTSRRVFELERSSVRVVVAPMTVIGPRLALGFRLGRTRPIQLETSAGLAGGFPGDAFVFDAATRLVFHL